MEHRVKLVGHYWGSLNSDGKGSETFVFGLVDGSGRLFRCYAYGYIASQLAKHGEAGQEMVVTGQITPFGIVVDRVFRLLLAGSGVQSSQRGQHGSGNVYRQP